MNVNKIRAFNSNFDIHVSRVGEKLHVEVLQEGKSIIKKNIEEGKTIKVRL